MSSSINRGKEQENKELMKGEVKKGQGCNRSELQGWELPGNLHYIWETALLMDVVMENRMMEP